MGEKRDQMERLIFVPIEPIEERYSAQWIKWFQLAFEQLNISPIIVGDIETKVKIKNGQFLDTCETIKYKLNQLLEITKLINDGFNGTIFFMDAYFPGIESIGYLKHNLNRNIRLEGMLHAGTWDQNDFITQNGMESWAKYTETGWLNLFDKLYVATEYHKDLIISKRGQGSAYIEVIDWPCHAPETKIKKPKEFIIVWPHRIAPEKNVKEYYYMKELYQGLFPNDKITWTTTKGKDKDQYYQTLMEARIVISTAKQETFGIAMQEAINYGCIPIAPNRLSYPETISKQLLYDDIIQACERIKHLYDEYLEGNSYALPPRYFPHVNHIVERIKI